MVVGGEDHRRRAAVAVVGAAREVGEAVEAEDLGVGDAAHGEPQRARRRSRRGRRGRRGCGPSRCRSRRRATAARPAPRRRGARSGARYGKPTLRARRGRPRPTTPLGRPAARAASPTARRAAGRVDGRAITCTSAISSGGVWRWVIVGERPTTSAAISRASSSVDAGTNPSRRTALRVAADDDHPAAVAHPVGAPVPHVERVHAVVGVARAVQVAVPVVVGVALLPLSSTSRAGRWCRRAPARRSRCSSGGAPGGSRAASGGS